MVGTTETAMNDLAQILLAMSEGDLTSKIDADYKGTFLEIKTNTNNMVDKLSDVIGKVLGYPECCRCLQG